MFKYWEIEEIKGYPYPNVYCPEMENKHPLGKMLEGYREFKQVENYLKTKYEAWVSWTKLENAHIMRMFSKIGAKPLEIDIKQDKIWFIKHLKG
jgi:hypothetical protein